jgi:hypothetical protein
MADERFSDMMQQERALYPQDEAIDEYEQQRQPTTQQQGGQAAWPGLPGQ